MAKALTSYLGGSSNLFIVKRNSDAAPEWEKIFDPSLPVWLQARVRVPRSVFDAQYRCDA